MATRWPRGSWIQGLVLTQDCSTLSMVQENQPDWTIWGRIIYNPENPALYETTAKSQFAIKWPSRKDRNYDLKVTISWYIYKLKSALKYWKRGLKCMRDQDKEWSSYLQLCSIAELSVTRLYSFRGVDGQEEIQNTFLWLSFSFIQILYRNKFRLDLCITISTIVNVSNNSNFSPSEDTLTLLNWVFQDKCVSRSCTETSREYSKL